MKGLELSEKFYKEFGLPLLQKEMPDAIPFLAIGLVGSGSECYGFDDELSCDHDFEPGFCIFIPQEDVFDNKTAFELEKIYNKLPKEFMGFKRATASPVGGKRHGVIRTSDFYKSKAGTVNGRLSTTDWFSIPETSLFEATNGKIFVDNYSEFSEIRSRLAYYPEDVRLKKLAGNLLLMGQAGQYNYPRTIKRGDFGAAQLSAFEFTKSAMNVVFLLNKAYSPYYKWSFHALKKLPVLSEAAEFFEYLISTDNSPEQAENKKIMIEHICSLIAEELVNGGLCEKYDLNSEKNAYLLNNKIKDNEIRNLNILYAV